MHAGAEPSIEARIVGSQVHLLDTEPDSLEMQSANEHRSNAAMTMCRQYEKCRQPRSQVEPVLVIIFDQIDDFHRLAGLQCQKRKRNRVVLGCLAEQLRNGFRRELPLPDPELVVNSARHRRGMLGGFK